MMRSTACSSWLIGVVSLEAAGANLTSRNLSRRHFGASRSRSRALDDPAILTGVSPLRGEWEASRGGEIAMVEKPVAAESPLAADVVIFSGERLGDLVDAGRWRSFPTRRSCRPNRPGPIRATPVDREPEAAGEREADSFQYMDFAPAFRDQVSRYGEDRLALPCGGSALVLAYRRDVFENEGNRSARAAWASSSGRPRPGLSSTRSPGFSITATGTVTASLSMASWWRWAPTRKSGRRGVSGTGRQPGAASRSVFVPVRFRCV